MQGGNPPGRLPDGGKTLVERDRRADITCVHDIRFSGDRVYVSAMDEGTLVTEDGSKSWQDITGDLPYRKPMIWSDMYFRMGSQSGEYYDVDATIPPDVKAAIPSEAELVYWDYYHDDAEVYSDFIERHRQLGKEPLMASGIWTWCRLWYDAQTTRHTVLPCITASRDKQLQEFFFTLWGDDGAYCEFNSALAGLAYGAEAAYNGETLQETRLQKRFAAICGADYKVVEAMSDVTKHGSAAILWDDPLLGIAWNERAASDSGYWAKALRDYRRLLTKMQPYAKAVQPVDLAHGVKLLQCLTAKIDLGITLRRAYAKGDQAALADVRAAVPSVIRSIDQLLASFRRQWHRRNKPQGFEVIQIRLAGLRERYREVAQRLDDLAAGKIECIPELDETAGVAKTSTWWRSLASASDGI